METMFVTTVPRHKSELETKWTVNYKIGKETFAVYNKNINTVYGSIYGNFCGQVIARCRSDHNYDTVYGDSDCIGLLTILGNICVKLSSGILRNPILEGIKIILKFMTFTQKKYEL